MSEVRLDPLKYRLKFLVLTLLAIGPSHGYELGKKIETLTMGLVRAGPGSIYPLLRELREEGLVEEELSIEGGRARKVYKLTEKGASRLLEDLSLVKKILDNLQALVGTALESLRGKAEGLADCGADQRVLDALRKLRSIVDEYIEDLESRVTACRGDGEGRLASQPPQGSRGPG